MSTTRKTTKREPRPDIEPVFVPGGKYLSLSDYAKREGITRNGAQLRVKRGAVTAVRVGPATTLVRINV